VSCPHRQVSGTGRSRKFRYGRDVGTGTLLGKLNRLFRRRRQVALESIHDGAGAKQVIQGAEGGGWQCGWSSRSRSEIGPSGGDVGAALIGQNQGQIQMPVLVYAPQDGERRALKRMMWTGDGDTVRKVAVVSSVWWFPSIRFRTGS
jgi:hypothetical protein